MTLPSSAPVNLECLEKEFQDVTAWLSILNFAPKQLDLFSRLQTGTGEWLLSNQTFRSWIDGNERILWCPGLRKENLLTVIQISRLVPLLTPKTKRAPARQPWRRQRPLAPKLLLRGLALSNRRCSAMVINWLESRYENSNVPIVYLYCSYKEEETQTVVNMIGSLLKQIVQFKGALPVSVLNLYETHSRKKTRPRLNELARLLQQEAALYSAIFVVVDALDECPEHNGTRENLLTELQRLPQNTRLLITSRYSQSIEEIFENVPFIDIRATDQDVRRYAEARIGREKLLAKQTRQNPALMEDIIKTIVENCQGMFVLPSCPSPPDISLVPA